MRTSYYTYVEAGQDAPITPRGVRWLTVIAIVLGLGVAALWIFALVR